MAHPLYNDSRITLDNKGLTIAGYYFPIGIKKRIPYSKIKKIEFYGMGFFSGRHKYWGGSFRHWFNLDWKRDEKTKAIMLHLGSFVRPIITPDDPDTVLIILQEKTGLTAVAEGGTPIGLATKTCRCGTKNDSDAVFCKKCGAKVK